MSQRNKRTWLVPKRISREVEWFDCPFPACPDGFWTTRMAYEHVAIHVAVQTQTEVSLDPETWQHLADHAGVTQPETGEQGDEQHETD